MEWACAECGRVYHEPPDACPICEHDVLVPAGGEDSSEGTLDRYLRRIRATLLNPAAVDRGLLSNDPRIALLFRLLAAVSGMLVVLVVLASVL